MAAVTPSDTRTGIYHFREAQATADNSGLSRFKTGYLTLANTVDDADTTTVDVYKEFGITKVLVVEGFIHTTEDSVVVEEDPTTAVTGTTLTITVGGSTDNKKRFYVVYGI